MYPFIQNGDILIIEPCNGEIVVGDVVPIHNDLIQLIIHRVITVTNDGYIIKGDNINDVDGIFLRSEILGRVIQIERGGKTVKFGLGREKVLISILSKYHILKPLVKLVNLIYRIARKRK